MEDMLRYLDEFVTPTIKDFEDEPTSTRLAFLACVATFHSVDYFAFDQSAQSRRAGTVGNIKKTFGEESEDFKIVDDVAHAFKHVVSSGRPEERLRSQDVTIRRGAFSSDFSPDFDISRVTIAGRPEINLLATVKRAVEFLRTYRPKESSYISDGSE
jgi:hypothetical protein